MGVYKNMNDAKAKVVSFIVMGKDAFYEIPREYTSIGVAVGNII